MSNWFTRIFTTNSSINDGYTQAQREALLDLFNFCMCADRRIEFSEQEFIEKEMQSFNWQSEETVAAFSKHSIRRADLAHKTDETRRAYAADIDQRLCSAELRALAIALSHQLFHVDREYVKLEKHSYSIVASAFGWAQ